MAFKGKSLDLEFSFKKAQDSHFVTRSLDYIKLYV